MEFYLAKPLVVAGYAAGAVVLLYTYFYYHQSYALLVMLGIVGCIVPLEVLAAFLSISIFVE